MDNVEKGRQKIPAILVVKCPSHERIFVSWKIGTRALCTKEIHQREGTARPQTSNDVDDDDEEEEEDGDDAEEKVDGDEEEEGDEN